LPAEFADGLATTALGSLALTDRTERLTGRGLVMLRPHQLRLADTPSPPSVPAQVTACRFRVHDHRIELAPHAQHDLPERLIVHATTATPPTVGETVHLAAHGTGHPLKPADTG
jgi:iron(III) transport system ATP-binding protein